ncbi:MAG: aminotransferase class V-fold PLP-dependent enzyme [Planctomycetaceae bacterium]|nr:aminotransferase class V-fold PLP-dependent enzyme [Planctomycetaceae bacterium]
MPSPYAHYWDIDPATTYLNHGSFGPAPEPVRRAREAYSQQLQRQPMRFFCQEMEELLEQSAERLAAFLKTKAARLALTDNATFAMNVAAESIALAPSDEVLLTDHEYGAVRNIWNRRCRRSDAKMVTVSLPHPLDDDSIVTNIAQAITEKTRVLVISHVTSPTAAILPVQRVCEVARQRGVLTVIDGPHAIAMLDVSPDEIGCDFYCASCHKWLSAFFGSGFLWAHPRHHVAIQCPVGSWGGSIAGRPATWQDRLNWLGTRDPAALLSIPAAIDFISSIGLKTFRSHAHALTCSAWEQLLELDGVHPLCTTSTEHFVSMVAVELPTPSNWKPGYHGHPDPLQIELRDQHGIEIPVGSWNRRRFLRVSAHLYNDTEDIRKLVTALKESQHL